MSRKINVIIELEIGFSDDFKREYEFLQSHLVDGNFDEELEKFKKLENWERVDKFRKMVLDECMCNLESCKINVLKGEIRKGVETSRGVELPFKE